MFTKTGVTVENLHPIFSYGVDSQLVENLPPAIKKLVDFLPLQLISYSSCGKYNKVTIII